MEKNSARAFAFSSYVFETRAGELTRAGKRIRIPDQAARLLALLLENPGTVVSREQLRQELWPEGHLQDYDHSIHRVVSQLREILRDRSSKPTQFIETLPKRGYRFTAPVELLPYTQSATGAASREASAVLPTELPASPPGIEAPQAALLALAEPPAMLPAAGSLPLPRNGGRLWILAALLLLVAAGSYWVWHRWTSAPAGPLTLGIPPFETNGPSATPIAESLRLNLADVLSQSPAIETRAVHSFDHIGFDEGQILSRAQKLGVKALLFGKFTVNGDQCQLHLELVRAQDGAHISSFQYSGNLQELAAISDRVERDVFERLHPSSKSAGLNPARPTSITAYEAYLRGRGYLQKWKDEDLRQAIDAFQQAVTEDPSYARAYAGMASAFFVLSQHSIKGAAQNLDQCQQFASKAIAIDSNLPEAHAMLGQAALMKDWNFAVAEQQLHQAIDLDPDHAVYHQWLAVLYGLEGKNALSLNEIDKAHAADPNWAPLYMTDIFLASVAGNYQRANTAADRLLQRMPDWSLAHEQYAMSLWDQGNYGKAIAEWRQAAMLEKNMDRVHLEDSGAEALKAGGPTAYARLRLHAIATRKGISHEEQDFIPAEWHAYAGDWEKSLSELSESVAERSASALQIGADPAYKPLHEDARYKSLLRQIGIPEV